MPKKSILPYNGPDIFKRDIFKPKKTTNKRYKIIAIDTEDKDCVVLSTVIYWGDNEWELFRYRHMAKQRIIDFAKSRKARKYILFAHNLAYDLVNVFFPDFDNFEIIMNNGNIIVAKLFYLRMFDTFNHSFTSLEKIGETIGIKKLPFDRHGEAYPVQDAKICWHYADHIQNMYLKNGVELPVTLASGAMNIWRTNYMYKKLPTFKTEVLDIIRAAYYGGRVETFFVGEVKADKDNPIWYLDINSQYPFVLQQRYTDINSVEYTEKPKMTDYGVALAEIETPKKCLPFLPYRTGDWKLIFPLGSWRSWYTLDELRNAEKLGYKVKLLCGFTTKYFVSPFSDFVHNFYNARMNAKSKQENLFYKLIMNSLYGKFATGKQKSRLVDYRFAIDIDSVQELYLGRYIYEKNDSNYPIYSNIIWAAEVTSKARYVLHDYLARTQVGGGNLLYCDTDSIIYKGPEIFSDSKELGKMKIVDKGKRVRIFGPKEYMFETELECFYKAKGIPKKVQKQFLEHRYAVYQRPIRLLEGLRRGIRPNKWVDVVKIKQETFTKRVVKKDGTTRPIRIGVKNDNG